MDEWKNILEFLPGTGPGQFARVQATLAITYSKSEWEVFIQPQGRSDHRTPLWI